MTRDQRLDRVASLVLCNRSRAHREININLHLSNHSIISITVTSCLLLKMPRGGNRSRKRAPSAPIPTPVTESETVISSEEEFSSSQSSEISRESRTKIYTQAQLDKASDPPRLSQILKLMVEKKALEFVGKVINSPNTFVFNCLKCTGGKQICATAGNNHYYIIQQNISSRNTFSGSISSNPLKHLKLWHNEIYQAIMAEKQNSQPTLSFGQNGDLCIAKPENLPPSPVDALALMSAVN